jgi:hypothetical protein
MPGKISSLMLLTGRYSLRYWAMLSKNTIGMCHANCLLDNHYHILVETQDSNLSLGMRQLNGVYTQRSKAPGRNLSDK